ncbi:MAG TPA: hypothetical protein PK522_10780 [Nitrosomonas sp.]|nr:hypothetical protein [Nitrosomonas sp.]
MKYIVITVIIVASMIIGALLQSKFSEDGSIALKTSDTVVVIKKDTVRVVQTIFAKPITRIEYATKNDTIFISDTIFVFDSVRFAEMDTFIHRGLDSAYLNIRHYIGNLDLFKVKTTWNPETYKEIIVTNTVIKKLDYGLVAGIGFDVKGNPNILVGIGVRFKP